jgi:copper homeostasis protein
MTPKVAVIGAGLAGLTAAHRLVSRGVEVTVIDKGRHGGGRMCTRNEVLPDGRTARFDLGPPLLYARLNSGPRYSSGGWPSKKVKSFADEVSHELLFQDREVGRIGAAGEPPNYSPIVGLSAKGGMRELPFRLLSAHGDALAYHDHTVAERLERTEDGWRIHIRSLRDQLERVISAHGLILTPPVPQTLELLEQSHVTVPDEIRDTLRRITYSQCIAVYGVFTGVDPLQPGGVWFGDGPFEWITDNHRKEVSTVPFSITALTTDDWTLAHWKETDAQILQELLPRLRVWVGTPIDPRCVWLQRWKWAKPLTPTRPPCVVARDLATVIAGDGFAAAELAPVDAAVASGAAAALRMGDLLTALARKDERYTIPRPRHFTLEIAVGSPDEAIEAKRCGADRLELSSGLDIGGLTPSLALFRAVREAVEIPIYVLLRPRAGSFTYTRNEFAVMQADAEMFLAEGANGIVLGALEGDRIIHRWQCRTLVDLAKGKAVFHRAFDFLPEPLVALDELIELGFERVLTSGGATTAEAGTVRLAALVQHAGWQIEILPAGSIRPENVADLVRATRCDQVHAAARVDVRSPLFAKHSRLALGMGRTAEMSSQLVRGLRYQLDQLVESLS